MTLPGNGQFVFVPDAVPDAQRLSHHQNQIRGSSSFGSATTGQNNVTVLHRERTATARGPCYLLNGAIPAGWQATINNVYMVGNYTPTIGITNPAIRVNKFISHAPGGSRLTAIDNYLKRNYYIPSK